MTVKLCSARLRSARAVIIIWVCGFFLGACGGSDAYGRQETAANPDDTVNENRDFAPDPTPAPGERRRVPGPDEPANRDVGVLPGQQPPPKDSPVDPTVPTDPAPNAIPHHGEIPNQP